MQHWTSQKPGTWDTQFPAMSTMNLSTSSVYQTLIEIRQFLCRGDIVLWHCGNVFTLTGFYWSNSFLNHSSLSDRRLWFLCKQQIAKQISIVIWYNRPAEGPEPALTDVSAKHPGAIEDAFGWRVFYNVGFTEGLEMERKQKLRPQKEKHTEKCGGPPMQKHSKMINKQHTVNHQCNFPHINRKTNGPQNQNKMTITKKNPVEKSPFMTNTNCQVLED